MLGAAIAWVLYAGGVEQRERRDQSCEIAERKQRVDVKRLRDTYAYAVRIPVEERGTQLNQAILEQIPQVEMDARLDDAPSFCDEEGIGLPEPDSRVPERPASLREPDARRVRGPNW